MRYILYQLYILCCARIAYTVLRVPYIPHLVHIVPYVLCVLYCILVHVYDMLYYIHIVYTALYTHWICCIVYAVYMPYTLRSIHIIRHGLLYMHCICVYIYHTLCTIPKPSSPYTYRVTPFPIDRG